MLKTAWALLFSLGVACWTLFLGVLARKLASKAKLSEENFYLGIPMTLSACSMTSAYEIDAWRRRLFENLPVAGEFGYVLLALEVLILLFIIGTHQDWEKEPPSAVRTRRLCYDCNILGGCMIIAFLSWRWLQ